MPAVIVDQVHRLAKKQRFLKEGFEFRDCKEHIVDAVIAGDNNNSIGVSDTEEEPGADDNNDIYKLRYVFLASGRKEIIDADTKMKLSK